MTILLKKVNKRNPTLTNYKRKSTSCEKRNWKGITWMEHTSNIMLTTSSPWHEGSYSLSRIILFICIRCSVTLSSSRSRNTFRRGSTVSERYSVSKNPCAWWCSHTHCVQIPISWETRLHIILRDESSSLSSKKPWNVSKKGPMISAYPHQICSSFGKFTRKV